MGRVSLSPGSDVVVRGLTVRRLGELGTVDNTSGVELEEEEEAEEKPAKEKE